VEDNHGRHFSFDRTSIPETTEPDIKLNKDRSRVFSADNSRPKENQQENQLITKPVRQVDHYKMKSYNQIRES